MSTIEGVRQCNVIPRKTYSKATFANHPKHHDNSDFDKSHFSAKLCLICNQKVSFNKRDDTQTMNHKGKYSMKLQYGSFFVFVIQEIVGLPPEAVQTVLDVVNEKDIDDRYTLCFKCGFRALQAFKGDKLANRYQSKSLLMEGRWSGGLVQGYLDHGTNVYSFGEQMYPIFEDNPLQNILQLVCSKICNKCEAQHISTIHTENILPSTKEDNGFESGQPSPPPPPPPKWSPEDWSES